MDAARAASGVDMDIAGFGVLEIPAPGRRATERELTGLAGPVGGKPYIGPLPRILTRRGRCVDRVTARTRVRLHEEVQAALVHYTASGSKYT